MAALEPPLWLKKNSLAHYFTNAEQPLSELKDGQRRRLYRQHAAHCLQCIVEDGYVRSWADISLATTCPIHNSPLIESCPGCGEPFSWNRGDLAVCAACDRGLSQYVQKDGGDPILNWTLSRVFTGKLGLKTLLSACDRMSRPADFLPGAPDYSAMSLTDVAPFIRSGAALLFESSFRQRYRDWLTDAHSELDVLGQDTCHRPLDDFLGLEGVQIPVRPRRRSWTLELQEQYERHATRTDRPVEEAEKLGIEAGRLRSWRSDIQSVDLTAQVSSEQLSEMLGYSQSQLKALSDSGLLQSINNVKTSRHLLFNIREVGKLFDQILYSCDASGNAPSDAALLLDLLPYLRNFLADFGSCMELLLSQQITCYRGKDLRSIQVSKSDFFRALHAALLCNQMSGTIHERAHLLVTTGRQIEALDKQIKHTLLSQSCHELMKQWVSLSRVARFSGIQSRVLSRELHFAGFEPVVDVPASPRPLVLYQSSEKLLEVITEQLGCPVGYWGYSV